MLVAIRVLVGTGLDYKTISTMNFLNDQLSRSCLVRRTKGVEVEELTLLLENDGNDESIDTQDTCHDNRDNGLEDQLWLQDTHG